MVDVWLLFSISLIFFVIVFHVIIDMASEGKLTLGPVGSSSPTRVTQVNDGTTKVAPASGGRPPQMALLPWSSSGGEDTHGERRKRLSDRIFRQALIFIPCYFTAFNFIYWIYIFA